ncbi:MAG TPA: DegQ family serine endoprotease [Dongiaceae bacterium]|nr:DegQ family serine endoprotease [Dongiaceae bacterium]
MILPLLAAMLFAAITGAAARSAPDSFADLAEKLLPAVVNVSTTQKLAREDRGAEELDEFFKEFFDRQRRENQPRPPTSLGSGFIVDAQGYVVTNNHVIAEADEITVRLHDNTELKATIVGRDEKTDLALLKVEPSAPLPALKWGDSDETRIGDWVLAIGNPFGLGGSVTAGIVSARQRDINAGPYDDFLQTDASINRGNSGGPMFNMDGEVIGINTAIFSPSGGSVGIGFAIPSALAKNVIDQIREYGHPRRGWLGVRIQTVTDELAEGLRLDKAHGALVANVTEGGPAAKAGIEQGDVVIEFDGRPIDEMRKLPRMVAETPIEKEVEVVVWRQGQETTLKVTLGELDETETAALAPADEIVPEGVEGEVGLLGLSLAEMSAEMRQRFELGEETSGVVITAVDEGGSAAEKGLRPGDVIVEVDQQAVVKPRDVDEKVNEAKANGYRVVTLLVYREGDFQWVALRIDQS